MIELANGAEVRLPADGLLFDALRKAGMLRVVDTQPWTTWGIEDEDEQGEFIRAWIEVQS